MEKVSIIVPNYNGSKYISEMIESVINQTYSSWELIIVDDGSTDNSEEIIEYYASEKIRFIKRPPARKKGGNTCRNIGIEIATGYYAIFLDSDDILATYCLEQRVKWMNSHKEIDFAVFNMYRFYDVIQKCCIHTKLDVENPLPAFLGLNCLWQTTSPIWKMSFVKNNKFNEDYSRLQDPEMIVRILLKTNVQYFLVKDSKPDAYYRIIRYNHAEINKKRNISSNFNDAFAQFIFDFYPLDKNDSCFDKSKISLFLQLSQHHLLASDKNNIKQYKTLVARLNVKLDLKNKLIYIIATHAELIELMRNKIARFCCSQYFKIRLKNIWGNISVNY